MAKSEEIRIGGVAVRFLVEGESGGSVAMFEFDVAAGAKVPVAHSHDAYEETAYGLEGVLTFTVDGQQREVGPGQYFASLAERSIASTTSSSAKATVLAIVTPGILGPDYFREMAACGSGPRRRSSGYGGGRRSDAPARVDAREVAAPDVAARVTISCMSSQVPAGAVLPSRTSLMVAAGRALGAREPDPAMRNPDLLAEKLLGPEEIALIQEHPIGAACSNRRMRLRPMRPWARRS